MIYAIINLTIDYRRSSDECDKREKKNNGIKKKTLKNFLICNIIK